MAKFYGNVAKTMNDIYLRELNEQRHVVGYFSRRQARPGGLALVAVHRTHSHSH